MFWILRRTGAVNFFNSINNNSSSKQNTNNNNYTEKNNPRPPRKAYGRLCVESDDPTVSMKSTNYHKSKSSDHLENSTCTNSISNNSLNNNNNNNNNNVSSNNQKNNHMNQGHRTNIFGQPIDETSTDMDVDVNEKLTQQDTNGIDENNKLGRLGTAMNMYDDDDDDDDDYDESLTCNVCDRAFHCHRQLASHQQKKRHFGCSGCDSLFSSLMLLEHHKEEFEHWSDSEHDARQMPCCRRNRIDDTFSDSDTISSDAESEDMERLL